MLKTRNIYIDTEAFVASNYFQSENLKRLSEFAKAGVVKLFITEITKREIIDNAASSLAEAVHEINEFKKKIAGKRVLKNIAHFKPYLDLPKLELNAQFAQIAQDLDTFILESRIQVIPYETADLNEVVSNYFTQAKPFGPGKKKHEFPDAIVVSSLKHWCSRSGEKMYLISGDNDMKGLGINSLLSIDSLKDMLNLINKQNSADELARMHLIDRAFEQFKETIIKEIEQKFEEKLIDELGFDISLDDVEVEEITLFPYSVVEDRVVEGQTTIQLDYDVHFSATVIYQDYSFGFYDREDDKYFGARTSRKKIAIGSTQTAEIAIEDLFSDQDNPDELVDVSITCTYTSIPDANDITDELDGYQFNY